ncbi:NAD(P)-dependent alcohol dehydrogenase [Aquirhabdus parva]|uniref:alcohol dehydrogenase (NADP(+)) n=2 Tax=Aquirhabdus parva TaxID=2283318 RepID=A0A345P840_9GAMM|nr:NAD(P)-dependent alcohol dehydrogenase [Aquirhabdus parva]AXI03449.1 NAD(P)-dependent alcohol dehydrogenase [Aquirhabdus parva]
MSGTVMTTIRAYAALAANQPLQAFQYEAGALKAHEVEVKVEYCGICHSDISVIDNEWGNSIYPVVGGHEIIGKITALGAEARGLEIGQTVGIGWTADSCQYCDPCIHGKQNLCATSTATIIGHHGGFAEKVRASWQWAIPLPDNVDPAKMGPMLCGGITVFAPLLQHNTLPIHKVGVVGIGGLGHMAIKLFKAWGCEVTAFSSNPEKVDEVKAMGAHQVVSSRSKAELAKIKGTLDLIVSTVNVPLEWNSYLSALAPEGTLHVVGAVLEPIPVPAFSLIGGAKSVSGSPTGSPWALRTMLDFAARHGIAPQVEEFPMSQINEAIEHVKSGKARYRVVLKADF